MVPISPLFQMLIKTNICLVRMKDPLLSDVLSPIKYVQLNTGVKKIQSHMIGFVIHRDLNIQ